MVRPATARRLPPYRGKPYWEKEKPKTAETRRVTLAYYTKAGRLQISYTFTDRTTGEKRRGKTVTLECEDLQLHPEALTLLAQVLEDWKG